MADLAGDALVLGSASPRRATLLASLGVPFEVRTVELDERALVKDGDDAGTASVTRIALAKFEAFGSQDLEVVTPRLLLTADTLVACDGVVLGKPNSDDHGATMLGQMSGQSLTISTAVCIGAFGSRPAMQRVTTMVKLRVVSTDEIDAYVSTGAGADKAAGLALQAEAKLFIASVDGCWSNVLGLPLCAVATALALPPAQLSQAERCSTHLCGDWSLGG